MSDQPEYEDLLAELQALREEKAAREALDAAAVEIVKPRTVSIACGSCGSPCEIPVDDIEPGMTITVKCLACSAKAAGEKPALPVYEARVTLYKRGPGALNLGWDDDPGEEMGGTRVEVEAASLAAAIDQLDAAMMVPWQDLMQNTKAFGGDA